MFLDQQIAERKVPNNNDCANRRDINLEHAKAFDKALSKAKSEFFDNRFGSKQLHLLILGTHPDFQRHGAGTKHCQWGMQLAQERKLPLTLFSSPMGQKLYSHLGFRMLSSIIVQVDGEDEKLRIGVMIFNAD